ncbi:uncharacterized protein [Diadema antillarum]|uniref:uncharacterized protein n=1 Tax=Diadema antillarum TaxID=105358 RepID=UPI003A89B809
MLRVAVVPFVHVLLLVPRRLAADGATQLLAAPPARGTCKVSELSFSNQHYYYACCEGTTRASPEEVVNWDCDPERKSFSEITDESRAFSCGGISGERNARRRCDERWRWLTSDSCFKWTECFKGVCEFEAVEEGSAADAAFCGDGRCDEKESSESCPTDCCPLVSDVCVVTNNTCPERCCNDKSCCSSSVGDISSGQFWLIVLSVVAGGIFLINLICCLCCCCCCKKCCCRRGRIKDKSNGPV